MCGTQSTVQTIARPNVGRLRAQNSLLQADLREMRIYVSVPHKILPRDCSIQWAEKQENLPGVSGISNRSVIQHNLTWSVILDRFPLESRI